MKADPIVLHYNLDPTVPPPEKPVAYDIEVKVDDVAMKSRMSHAAVNMTSESTKELAKIDDEVCQSRVDALRTLTLRADRAPHAIPPERAPQAHVPPVFRRQAPGVHPDLARISVARPRHDPRQWPERWGDSQTGRSASQRVLPLAVGRRGGRDTGRSASCVKGWHIGLCVVYLSVIYDIVWRRWKVSAHPRPNTLKYRGNNWSVSDEPATSTVTTT